MRPGVFFVGGKTPSNESFFKTQFRAAWRRSFSFLFRLRFSSACDSLKEAKNSSAAILNFSIHQRLEQIILLVKHFFIYFLYIISIKINVKRLIDFLIATILCNLSFAEYSDYLENSTNFSPLECGIISNVEHFFTREYFEFAKMYNTRDKKTAIADFRKLLNNARHPKLALGQNWGF